LAVTNGATKWKNKLETRGSCTSATTEEMLRETVIYCALHRL